MKTRKAVYAASLDPITNGHLNIIERSSPLYDELCVLVAVDLRKTYTFTAKEREQMAKEAVTHLPNVRVSICDGQYVVKRAEELNASVIIRGLRDYRDLSDEQILAEENRKICPSVETMLIPCLPELMHVSSSMVKAHVGVDPSWVEQVARSVPATVAAKLKEKYIIGKARKHWDTLMKMVGNPEKSDKVFASLVKSYSESHRGYHTLEHIVSMLDEFEEVRENVSDIVATLFSIWYHDKVYDTDTKNHSVTASNEARSAYEAMCDIKELGLPKSLDEDVGSRILATAHTEPPTESDHKYLVDLDLAILGKPEKQFDAYEDGIKKEYSHIPHPVFCRERAKILRMFLKRASMYSTKHFVDKYRDAAKKNLERSIAKLEEAESSILSTNSFFVRK